MAPLRRRWRISRTRVQIAALVGLCVTAAACAVPTVRPAAQMVINNYGRQAVSTMQERRCGEPDSAFKAILGTAIARGASIALPLRDGCIDLAAVGADGTIVGRQNDLQMIPGSTWTIR